MIKRYTAIIVIISAIAFAYEAHGHEGHLTQMDRDVIKESKWTCEMYSNHYTNKGGEKNRRNLNDCLIRHQKFVFNVKGRTSPR